MKLIIASKKTYAIIEMIGGMKMEKNRSTQLIAIIALVVGIIGLSVGFASFSSVLSIKSSADVKPDKDSFTVVFSTEPGQKAVYSFYAYNAGELTAYLNSIIYSNVVGQTSSKGMYSR